jgi:hypothetical protein
MFGMRRDVRALHQQGAGELERIVDVRMIAFEET